MYLSLVLTSRLVHVILARGQVVVLMQLWCSGGGAAAVVLWLCSRGAAAKVLMQLCCSGGAAAVLLPRWCCSGGALCSCLYAQVRVAFALGG